MSMPEQEPEERSQDDRKPLTPEQIDGWVEHSIKAAQRRGDFDNLPGAGKPLRSLEGPAEPDWWLRGLIQREKLDLTAALPGPMALRRERSTYPESLVDIADEGQVREVLLDFNERVLADRRRPVATVHSPVVVGRVDVEDMVRRWRDLRGQRLVQEDLPPPPEPAECHPRGPRRRWWQR